MTILTGFLGSGKTTGACDHPDRLPWLRQDGTAKSYFKELFRLDDDVDYYIGETLQLEWETPEETSMSRPASANLMLFALSG